MREKEQKIKYIEEQIKTLPREAQKVISWLVENIDLVNQMLEGEKFTKEEITKFTHKALETKDYIMLVMVLYKQNKDQYETEAAQQEN